MSFRPIYRREKEYDRMKKRERKGSSQDPELDQEDLAARNAAYVRAHREDFT